MIAAPGRAPTTTAPAGLAAALATAAWIVLLVVMPPAMVLANKSSAAMLVVATLLALGAQGAAGAAPALRARAADLLRTPEAAVAGVAALWILASSLWSADRMASLRAVAEFGIPVLSAVVLAVALPRPAPRWAVWALAAAIILVTILTVVSMRLDMPLHRALGLRFDYFVLNRPVVLATLLAWPLVALAGPWRRGDVAALILLPLFVAAWVSPSGTAVLATVVGGLVYALARLAPRLVLALAGAGMGLAIALAPFAGDIVRRTIPEKTHTALQDSHSRDRMMIWESFGEVVRLRPWTGTGFGSSAFAARDQVAQEVAPQRRTLLAVGHPHNAVLQVWSELGLPGAMLLAAFAALVWRRLARTAAERLAAPLALLAVVWAVALVSHGAWQAWWAAGVGAAIVLMGAARPETSAQGAHDVGL